MNLKILIYVFFLSGVFTLVAQDVVPKNNGQENDYLINSRQRFRIGEILDAGITRAEIPVANADKLIPADIAEKTYAVVRVRLDANRSIGIHDFSMIHNYQPFPCVAIRPPSGKFNAEKRIFSASKKPEIYDLLFILNVPNFRGTIKYRCTLHYNLSTSGLTNVDIEFKNYNRSPVVLNNSGQG
ncbi:MAG: hypothetical protein JXR78_02890 [Victivallales bacterium]|nr:hypothetical protein [Victivallales bacterium]